MKYIWLPICSLLIGAITGSILTFSVPVFAAKYLAVAILAALDSVLGGVRSIMEDSFDGYIMLTGFFTNALLAAGLAFLGDKIGVDMYLAATVCFGLRLFSNLGYIRRFLINKLYDHREAQKNRPNKKRNQTTPSSTIDPELNVINQIIEGNTAEANKPTEDTMAAETQANLATPAKNRTRSLSRGTEVYIQELLDDDVKEYTKMKQRKQRKTIDSNHV